MNKVIGLCAGRHDVPVGEFIFNGEINPVDFAGMDKIVHSVLGHKGITSVTLYVTGLTAAVGAVVGWCSCNGVALTLLHYDRTSGQYLPQEVVGGRRCPYCGALITTGWYCHQCGSN